MPPQQTQSGGGVYSPMSGKVLKTHVKEGDSVKSGDLLLVLEAMKMENMILASTSGVVKNMSVRDGDTVDEGQCLMTLG
jgi:biotin carboxyl carrier protein